MQTVAQLLSCRRNVSADMAHRLSRALNTAPGVWMRLQEVFDLWVTEKKNRQQYAKIAVLKSVKAGYDKQLASAGWRLGVHIGSVRKYFGPCCESGERLPCRQHDSMACGGFLTFHLFLFNALILADMLAGQYFDPNTSLCERYGHATPNCRS